MCFSFVNVVLYSENIILPEVKKPEIQGFVSHRNFMTKGRMGEEV